MNPDDPGNSEPEALRPSGGQTDDQRRLELLRSIAEAGGTLAPKRTPNARLGYVFGGVEESDEVEADLKFLEQRDYVRKIFYDRITICVKCSSHHLNIREACPSCNSVHITFEPLLHHFRCGYVGRISEFETTVGKIICPKCAAQLKYAGTDYDRMGKSFLCLSCAVAFQDPPASSVCLVCENSLPAEDLNSAEIFSYLLSSLGTAAIRNGKLFELDAEALYIADLPIYRPTVILELMRQEAARVARYKVPFTLVFLSFERTLALPDSAESSVRILTELQKQVRPTDSVGQLKEQLFVILLSNTPLKGANVFNDRFQKQLAARSLSVRTELVEIPEAGKLEQALREQGIK